MLLSVIIPTKNSAKSLESSILSVVNQDFTKKEIIIIDGNSTDNTVDIVNLYKKFISISVSEPDQGIYDALNKGINLAKGEWIYFLGSDDRLIDKFVLSDVLNFSDDCKLLYGNVILGCDGRLGLRGGIYDGEFSKFKLSQKNICHQSIFYHRSLFDKLGKFDLNYNIAADWVFNMKAFSLSETNPLFLNRTIAIYANTGFSNNKLDSIFRKNKNLLIKKHLGILTYLLYIIYKKVVLKKQNN